MSVAAAAALLVLAIVAGFFMKINYDARVRAESAQQKAEDNYAAYLKEQDEKRARMKESAPAFLRAAHLTTEEKDFPNALAQVTVALESDADLTDAYLLQGQLLIALKRFEDAGPPLQEYLKRKPEDALARGLADLAAKPEPETAAYFLSLHEIFKQQKARAFEWQMTRLAEPLLGPMLERLPVYQKQVDAAWAGYGKQLVLIEGQFRLDLHGLQEVQGLEPIKGLPLSELDISGTKVESLAPLREMPLVAFHMRETHIRDLGPLHGMKLKRLDMYFASEIAGIEPLEGMPLEYLECRGCVNITSLAPLRNMPLTYLSLMDCQKVSDIRPLEGMKLKTLDLFHCYPIKDLSPLRNMPLEVLSITGLEDVHDFEPLRTLKLKTLIADGTNIDTLELLKDMPLTQAHFWGCPRIKDLTPLRNLKITSLNLMSCQEAQGFDALQDMPLTWLELSDCTHVRDLKMLRGKKLTYLGINGCKELQDLGPLKDMQTLESLGIMGCSKIQDLSPLDGLNLKIIGLSPRFIAKESMAVLQRMKSLETFAVDGGRSFPAPKFWELYEKGEFSK